MCCQDSKSLATGMKDLKGSKKCIPHLKKDCLSVIFDNSTLMDYW